MKTNMEVLGRLRPNFFFLYSTFRRQTDRSSNEAKA